ncbi:hypothetical protein QJS04_geneDACA004851 [Acorus gramineus]|uniref:Uncharacterized protein n=1 Tax=Acorus gramineus TaxID=55184 RepID=A0AAV9BS46_ACOGR|nr:hypothetical protein QJS04_geneDACA004851 [Acorus gramineus]
MNVIQKKKLSSTNHQCALHIRCASKPETTIRPCGTDGDPINMMESTLLI